MATTTTLTGIGAEATLGALCAAETKEKRSAKQPERMRIIFACALILRQTGAQPKQEHEPQAKHEGHPSWDGPRDTFDA
jgi:hypothetical protein